MTNEKFNSMPSKIKLFYVWLSEIALSYKCFRVQNRHANIVVLLGRTDKLVIMGTVQPTIYWHTPSSKSYFLEGRCSYQTYRKLAATTFECATSWFSKGAPWYNLLDQSSQLVYLNIYMKYQTCENSNSIGHQSCKRIMNKNTMFWST